MFLVSVSNYYAASGMDLYVFIIFSSDIRVLFFFSMDILGYRDVINLRIAGNVVFAV